MSIDAGAQVAIILLAYGPCVVIVNLLGQVCTLGRAPRTKETLPDFREWCRVTRHSRVFHGLTGCQRTPGLGGHKTGHPGASPWEDILALFRILPFWWCSMILIW